MDTDLKTIIKPFISKSHPIVKNFIASGDLETSIEEIVINYNLNDQEKVDVVDLVTEILIGLRDPAELFDQLSEITGLPSTLSEDLGVAIQNIILDTLASKITISTQLPTKPTPNNVGQSFEQIILNQARAMQPAFASPKPSSEGGLGYSVAKPADVPSNLPIEKPVEERLKISVPNYSDSSDPYREPL